MSFQGSMKSLKLYENFGLHVYFSGGKGPELLSETLTLSHCTPSPESLSGTHEASCPTGPSVFSPPLSPLLSSSPSPRMRGRAILYVDLVPLHLHPGPWNPTSTSTHRAPYMGRFHVYSPEPSAGGAPMPEEQRISVRCRPRSGLWTRSPAASVPSHHPLPTSSSLAHRNMEALSSYHRKAHQLPVSVSSI